MSVGDTSGEIDEITAEEDNLVKDTLESVESRAEFTLTTEGAVELNSDAVIYEYGTDDTMDLRDIEDDAVVHVLFDGDSDYWVSYMLVEVDNTADDDDPATGETMVYKGTYELDGNTYIRLDDDVYPYVGGDITATNGDEVEVTFDTIREETVVIEVE